MGDGRRRLAALALAGATAAGACGGDRAARVWLADPPALNAEPVRLPDSICRHVGPDLKVVSLEREDLTCTDDGHPGPHLTIISMVVQNVGGDAPVRPGVATGFPEWLRELLGGASRVPIADVTIWTHTTRFDGPRLACGQALPITIDMGWAGGPLDVAVAVDPTHAVAETDEENNAVSVELAPTSFGAMRCGGV